MCSSLLHSVTYGNQLKTHINFTAVLNGHNDEWVIKVEVSKKMAGSRWTCFGVRVHRTLDYPTINLNPY